MWKNKEAGLQHKKKGKGRSLMSEGDKEQPISCADPRKGSTLQIPLIG